MESFGIAPAGHGHVHTLVFAAMPGGAGGQTQEQVSPLAGGRVNSHFVTFLLLVEKDSPSYRDDLRYPAVREVSRGWVDALAAGLSVWEVPGADGVSYAPLTACELEFGDPMGADETLIEASLWAGREIPQTPSGDEVFPFSVQMLRAEVPAVLTKLFAAQGLAVRLLQVKFEKTYVARQSGVYA